ncbi:MAG: transcription elongation factor GreA [Firmicutes bacterium]|jgi:transcription elongation factor GreA|nr:transcription elongation factor GreA [Bacillota bacterium]
MADEIMLTKEGFEKVKAEYEQLVTVERKAVAERLKEARAFGDLSENAEYDAAKNEQAELEERIAKLDNMMRNAKIVDYSSQTKGIVNVGTTVVIQNPEKDAPEEYSLVVAAEADLFANKISNESAVGKALIGHKVGDVVDVDLPNGKVTYEIIAVELMQ